MFQILIADDEPNIREGVRQFITRRCPEWQVVGAARDGKEALEMAERFLPDCIMTDITMPHVNGLEFLEKIKEELPDAKLLILSGYDDFNYAKQAINIGVEDYLLKPITKNALIERRIRLSVKAAGHRTSDPTTGCLCRGVDPAATTVAGSGRADAAAAGSGTEDPGAYVAGQCRGACFRRNERVTTVLHRKRPLSGRTVSGRPRDTAGTARTVEPAL